MRGGSNALMLQGQRYGCYRVVGRAPHTSSTKEHARWNVVCETCGYTKTVAGHNLVRRFPLRCNHVPAGHRVVGPREFAALEAIRELDRNSVTLLEDSGFHPLVALAEAIEAMGGE